MKRSKPVNEYEKAKGEEEEVREGASVLVSFVGFSRIILFFFIHSVRLFKDAMIQWQLAMGFSGPWSRILELNGSPMDGISSHMG